MPDRLVAVNDADYRLPEPVRQSLATDLADSATELGESMFGTYADQQRMGIKLPTQVTYASIQSACDSAATFGTRVWAAGSITTDQTLTVRSDADLGGLTINYTGSSVAVRLGTESGVTWRLNVVLPRIFAANKGGAGWASVAGTVGVDAVNLNSCVRIDVPHIEGFETGLQVRGQGQGNSYNTFAIGHLANNKINHSLTANSTGWSNQNTYIGGRFGHNSAEGTNTSGTAHVRMAAGITNPINNNVWINPSLEGNTAEWIVDFAGSYNVIVSGRYEAASPKIRWQNSAVANLVLWGYNAEMLTEAFGTSAFQNQIIGQRQRLAGSGTNGLIIAENSSSSAAPILTGMAAGSRATADPATAWMFRLAADKFQYKRAADAFARVAIDGTNGRLYFGDGTADSTRYIGALGTAIGITGSHFLFGNDNTYDLGTASNRPRYVRAGTAIQTGSGATGGRPTASTAGVGAMFFDTTLNKPIWSTGSAWVDSAGTTV